MLGDCRAAAMKHTPDSQAISRPVVLVVDDEPITRLLAREALEGVGLVVVEAGGWNTSGGGVSPCTSCSRAVGSSHASYGWGFGMR